MNRAHPALTLAFCFLSACSSITSIEQPSGINSDGLAYYMPKKDFLITVTVKDKKATKVTLGTTAPYPDLSTQYSLRHGSNPFGKNTLDVGVNESGLLSSTKSTTQSNVNDVFKNLATSIGQARTLVGIAPRLDNNKPESCPANTCADGDHTFVHRGTKDGCFCGAKITIKQIPEDTKVVSHAKEKNTEYSGIFYRQDIPYLINAEGDGLNVASIVFSPSDSKTHFLPVSQTFFSNNEADLGFSNGVPTKYKQQTDGEALALLKLPADIISAYFSAVGTVFDSFKANDGKEAAALSEALKLELAKKKYDACIAAIKANDDVKIKELACQ